MEQEKGAATTTPCFAQAPFTLSATHHNLVNINKKRAADATRDLIQAPMFY
ncbi:hypothetical protein [Neobacillus vireti]|uniref:hypothetical protein n=1 Tax=Neobacillus vireti TaxID=220686 RepID=UPI002FFDFDD0